MKRVYLIITMALTMLISVPVGYTQSPFNLPERDQDDMALEYTLQRFNHIEDVLNTCPQNDPYYGTIRSQFVIRRNGIWVGDIPCTEPVSEMPISQYSDELITLQALRVMFYMDRGQSGHLPWTPGTLYDWVKSKIQGINLSDTAEDNHCCDGFWDGTYIVIQTEDDEKRDFKRNWMGISAAIALYAHETRHVDGFGHLFCCPFCADGTCGVKAACDQTFDPSNLSPYGIQWWLNKSWLMGDINVGFSCLSPEEVQEIANWHLASTTMVYGDRFCDNVPPEVSLPQNPGGICERAFAPGTPGGPVSGAAGSGYGYTAAGASCSTGDFVHYLFDWGDGSYSGWCVSNVNNMAHAYKTWVSPGTYTVKAQARCSYNPIIRSDWSPGLTVTITTPSFIITSPKGEEKWQAGSTQTIKWTYGGKPYSAVGNLIKIELLKGETSDSTLPTNVPAGSRGSGSYHAIPLSQAPGSEYRIRVTYINYSKIMDTY